MPTICKRFAKYMPMTSPWNAQDMPKICQRSAKDMTKICQRYAKDLHKVCTRYSQEILNICSIYIQDMLNICLRCAQDLQIPQICPTYAQDMIKVCLRYAWYNSSFIIKYLIGFQFLEIFEGLEQTPGYQLTDWPITRFWWIGSLEIWSLANSLTINQTSSLQREAIPKKKKK